MKNMKKVLLIFLCLAAIIGATIMGTLAWLTDKEIATNTFTVGKVDITVDEAKVNPDGTPVANADRVKENKYHLIPGQTYIKDPTMTVDKDSEEAYVRMLLTINHKSELDEIFAPGIDLTTIFQGFDGSNWKHQGETLVGNTVIYEFRYKETVKPNGSEDVVLDALFDSFTIPNTLDGDDLKKIENLTITVEGHAIQAAGFADADAAWAAFEQQVNP